MPIFTIGSTQQLSRHALQCIELDNRQYVLVHQRGEFYLLDNLCPHKAAALCEGDLVGDQVLCPWHRAGFDIKTGRGLSPLAGKGVQSWSTYIQNEQLLVKID